MALIPGTLPSDTCYGTPQDLLELFAQYLDVPALSLNSKVFFSNSQPNVSDAIWFDTNSALNYILKIKVGGNWTDYVNNYLVNLATVTAATGDFVLVQDISDSNKSKKVTAQTIANLAPAPAAGSITYSQLNNNIANTIAGVGLNVKRRAAFAWVSFNGWYGFTTGVPTSAAILSSFNIDTITWTTSTNLYQITFIVAAPDINYCVQTASSGLISATDIVAASVTAVSPVFNSGGTNLNSTSSFAIRVVSGSVSYRDRFIFAVIYAAVS
jgi:hypothetical protein